MKRGLFTIDAAAASLILVLAVLLWAQAMASHNEGQLQHAAISAQRLRLYAASETALRCPECASNYAILDADAVGNCTKRIVFDGDVKVVSICERQ